MVTALMPWMSALLVHRVLVLRILAMASSMHTHHRAVKRPVTGRVLPASTGILRLQGVLHPVLLALAMPEISAVGISASGALTSHSL